MVQVAIVQVIDMVFMPNTRVATVRAVPMSVAGVALYRVHCFSFLSKLVLSGEGWGRDGLQFGRMRPPLIWQIGNMPVCRRGRSPPSSRQARGLLARSGKGIESKRHARRTFDGVVEKGFVTRVGRIIMTAEEIVEQLKPLGTEACKKVLRKTEGPETRGHREKAQDDQVLRTRASMPEDALQA
jgi:hypothetical protein